MLNKKADAATLWLVFMALFLVGATIVVFIVHSNKIGSEIKDSNVLGEVYERENEMNFYINEILDKSMQGFKEENEKRELINNITNELNNYKINENYIIEELSQVEEQIKEDNIIIENNKITITFNLYIKKKFNDKLTVLYSYKREFVRLLDSS